MNFQISKEITQNQSENGREGWGAGADFQGQLCGEGRMLHFFLGFQEVPGSWLVYASGTHHPQLWGLDRGDV